MMQIRPFNMGLIGYLIGRFIKGRAKKKRRKKVQAALNQADLSEQERRQLSSHKRYVIENGTGGVLTVVALGFLALVGIGFGGLGLLIFQSGAPIFIWGFPMLGGVFFIGLSYYQFSKIRRASKIYDMLTSQPRQLANTSPDDF